MSIYVSQINYLSKFTIFFGSQEIGDTHLGLDVTPSIQPSNNRLFISEFKKFFCLAEKFPLGNSKLLISPIRGNLTPCSIQPSTVSDAPCDFEFSKLLRKLFFMIHVNKNLKVKIIRGKQNISMNPFDLYPYFAVDL